MTKDRVDINKRVLIAHVEEKRKKGTPGLR